MTIKKMEMNPIRRFGIDEDWVELPPSLVWVFSFLSFRLWVLSRDEKFRIGLYSNPKVYCFLLLPTGTIADFSCYQAERRVTIEELWNWKIIDTDRTRRRDRERKIQTTPTPAA